MVNSDTVKEWILVKYKLAQAKETELNLRKSICEHILNGKIKGAKKGVIGAYTLTATAKLNQSLDKELLRSLWPDLAEAERKCIEFVPKLVTKEYKTLDEESKMHRAINSKPGAPTLEVKGVENGN